MQYRIIKSRRRKRTISLQVDSDGQIVIRSPYLTSRRKINQFVSKKSVWIKEKLAEIKKAKLIKKKFINNEKFLYLGNGYPLLLVESGDKDLCLKNSKFLLKKTKKNKARKLFEDWYKRKAKSILEAKVIKYANKYNFKVNNVKISWAKKRWGSCSAKNNLNFNWRIIMAPIKVIDYLVVHELCHLKHNNHSKNFWQNVEDLMPDYKQWRDWLKSNQYKLDISV